MREPTCADLVTLCQAMRPADAREVFALRSHDDPVRVAYEIFAMLPRARMAFVAGLDSEAWAAAFLGLWPMDESGGVLVANLIGTKRIARVAPALIARVRSVILPELIAQGVRRAECRVMQSHVSAREFLRACGAREEGILPDLGRNRETYIQCAWRLRDWETVHVHNPQTTQAYHR